MQRIFHTPEGVRDIYSQECSRKQKLQEKLHRVFHQYGFEDIESKYNLINIISNVKRIYSVFKLEYNDLTETMLNFIYTKDNFNKDEFYKKIRSRFIKFGYTDEKLKDDINHILSTLVKYNIIDENYKINKNLTTKTL